MSSLRQGVLRAVRLLPETVKIGIEPETALPSTPKEEQRATGEPIPSKEATPDSAALKERDRKIEELQLELAASVLERQSLEDQEAALRGEQENAKAETAQKAREFASQLTEAKAAAQSDGFAQGLQEGKGQGYSEGLKQAQDEVKAEYLEKFGALVSLLEGFPS